VFLAVLHVLGGNTANERVGRVGISKQRTNAKQDLGDGQRRTPIVLQYIETNDALRVYIAVINASLESDLWWFKGIVWLEVDVEEKDAALIAGARWAKNSRNPLV